MKALLFGLLLLANYVGYAHKNKSISTSFIVKFDSLKDSTLLYDSVNSVLITDIPDVAFNTIIINSKLHIGQSDSSLIGFLKKCGNYQDTSFIKQMRASKTIQIPLGCLKQDSVKAFNILIKTDAKKDFTMLKLQQKAPATNTGKEDSNKDKNADNDRDKVLQDLKKLGISLGDPAFMFITRDMFDGLPSYGYISPQRCMNNKYDRQLPGEFIWLYDMKSGDYYTLKKKTRKPIPADSQKGCPDSPGCKTCCKEIEYYKWKKSMWYTPPIGSQFKVEFMNYSKADSINLSFTYRDNFLEDEAQFKSLLQSANTASPKDTTPTTDATNNPNKAEDANGNADEKASNLIALRNDLNYYNDHFIYNSTTANQHSQNLRYINRKITEKFGKGVTLDSLVRKYKIDMQTDDDLNTLMKQIQKLYHRIYNYSTYSFLATKLKNYDYLDITFKDNKGTEINKEEMRLWGGFKIDFSSGVFLTGLKDDNYVFTDSTVKYRPFGDTPTSITTLRDTTGKIAIKENSGKQKIAFGVLMHAYPRISSNYNIALTAGLSVNTQTELNVLLGGSILLGSTRRLVLTGGVIWGKVNKLSNTVRTGLNRMDGSNIYSSPIFYNTTNGLVPTVSDYSHSFFFGISYNFTAN